MNSKMKKISIPKRVREIVWKKYIGKKWRGKCSVSWCDNKFSVLSAWHVGHNKPESKGGDLSIDNLRPICAECNLGMGNRYSIDEWSSEFDKYHAYENEAIKIIAFLILKRNKCYK
tara:strand:- start:102 stop:449 length:348 start_codon:yes stop_codon:yes gene_type:complete